MKQAQNVFSGGLSSDLHPLNAKNDSLTDALNATFITRNGNEALLQNDMGNTLIQDSLTGNVMGLSDGFIPVGMKEYGGILYIASYNPETDKSELGTIPSPKISYLYSDAGSKKASLTLADPSMKDPDGKIDNLYNIITDQFTCITDTIFKVGDKFIVILNLEGADTITKKKFLNANDEIEYPTLTKRDKDGNVLKLGWYDVVLYALPNGKQPIRLNTLTPQAYYVEGNDELQYSNYWFINKKDLSDKLDIDQMMVEQERNGGLYISYPNITSGRLAIKLEPCLPGKIHMMVNKSAEKESPNMYVTKTEFKQQTNTLQTL